MLRVTYLLVVPLIALAFFVLWKVSDYGALGQPMISGQHIIDDSLTVPSTTVSYTYERVANGLFVPWSIVFTDETRMLVSERSGAIRVIENGLLQQTPVYVVDDVSTNAEEGLMGLAVDPLYEKNGYIYACYAYERNGGLRDRVVRLRDQGHTLTQDRVILDDIPAAQYHAGCRLGFGPDGMLYITTGDATEKELAQDQTSLAGKILRITRDGDIPADNPFANSPVWSVGHRNSQGIAWHPVSGVLISTEHGPTLFDGPAGGDEVNRIVSGQNYGWPVVSHDNNKDGLIAPLIQFTPAVAPASAMMYGGEVFAPWKGNLLFGGLKGEGMYRVQFDSADMNAVVVVEKLTVDVGRVRDVVEGPDGFIYFSSSNRDGRGSARDGDDAIYRLVPKE